MNFGIYFVIIINLISQKLYVRAWTSEELELFDLVDEINQNFYEVLNLDQSAVAADIRKAYRRLSLQYHPDKNKDEGAEEHFRKIVAVSEVLKDDERRKQYDLILKNGLPDWKQPIFYFRRVRKMGLFELFAFLSILLTAGHFILLWATYWERKYELEEVLTARFKKKKPKKFKVQETSSDDIIASQVNLIPKPAINDLLPALIVKFFVNCVREFPNMVHSWRTRHQEFEEELNNTSDDETTEEKVRKPRKKVKTELPDYYSLAPTNTNRTATEDDKERNPQYSEMEVDNPREWTKDDVVLLMKTMNRFPGGTTNRWEKIASTLKRSVEEVTVKVKSLSASPLTSHPVTALQGITGRESSTLSISPGPNYEETQQSSSETQCESLQRNKFSALDQADSEGNFWSQVQQKALEAALQKFPKGREDRWIRIAEQVPGKNKEECLVRYKVLVELVKKKKSQTAL